MTAHQNHHTDGDTVASGLRAALSPHTPRRLIAFTNDAALAHALEELAGAGVNVCIVADVETLSTELLSTSDAIALLDTGIVTAPIDGFVDAMATQFPDLRLIVAGHSLDQSLLATRIASQRVFRFLHKPASAQRLKLFVDAASRPGGAHDTQRTGMTQAVEILKEPALRMPQLSLPGGPGGISRNRLLQIVAAIGAALVVGLIVMLNSGDPAPAKVKVAPIKRAAPSVTTTPPANEEALVQRADQAFAAGRYAATDGSSAAELYGQALALVRTDERARSGLTRSVDFALREAESSLTAGRIDEVESRIAALTRVSPGNPRLEFLVAQLGRERERAATDEARRNASEGRQARLRASLTLVSERLRKGALLEPARDSALFHLRAAQEIAPGDQDVDTARDSLIARLLSTADSELQSRQVGPARRLLDAAGNLGAESAALDKLRRSADQITTEQAAAAASARTEPAAAATPAAAPAPATGTAASNGSGTLVAAANTSPANDVVLATSLKQLRKVEAEFPQRALERGVSGWVDLEFTVGRDGSVQGIFVKASEPKDVFDDSAVNAARKWRYAPVLRDGQPVEQRARVRIRYTAKDK